MANEITIRGTADGLLVLMPDAPAEQAARALIERIEANKAFFEGATCPIFIEGGLNDDALEALRSLLAERYGLTNVRRAARRDDAPPPAAKAGGPDERESYALTVSRTVRNGQRIAYQGDLIVVGDANPGSHLIAGGNIYVLGALRGVAHAGALGDEGASVAAFRLRPTQIRIAQHIARSPEGGTEEPDGPEIATVRGGGIEIAPCRPARAREGGLL